MIYVIDARGYDEPELIGPFATEEDAVEYVKRTERWTEEDGIEPDVWIVASSLPKIGG